MNWNEELHPRDHGKFSHSPGAAGRMAEVKVTKAGGRMPNPFKKQQLHDELVAASNHFGYVHDKKGKLLATGWLRGVHEGNLHVQRHDGSVTQVPLGHIGPWNHDAARDETPYHPGGVQTPAASVGAPAAKAAPMAAAPAQKLTGTAAQLHALKGKYVTLSRKGLLSDEGWVKHVDANHVTLSSHRNPNDESKIPISSIHNGGVTHDAIRGSDAPISAPTGGGQAARNHVVDQLQNLRKGLSAEDDMHVAHLVRHIDEGGSIKDAKSTVSGKYWSLPSNRTAERTAIKLVHSLPEGPEAP